LWPGSSMPRRRGRRPPIPKTCSSMNRSTPTSTGIFHSPASGRYQRFGGPRQRLEKIQVEMRSSSRNRV
jgi:hypothetical protein